MRFALLLLLACSPAALAQRPPAASRPAPATARDSAPALGYAGPANFSHRPHRELECATCHTSERRHGELVVRTERDCQSCHHARERLTQCAECHGAAEIRATKNVATSMRLSVWNAPRPRQLPFQHAQHESVTCTTCHTTPVTLAVSRDCRSCHEQHHTAEQSCRTCHAPSPKEEHRREAHLGCAGSGCHTLTGTVQLTATRNVCLTCHQDMVNHRPGRECGQCHQVQWSPNAPNPTRRGAG